MGYKCVSYLNLFCVYSYLFSSFNPFQNKVEHKPMYKP